MVDPGKEIGADSGRETPAALEIRDLVVDHYQSVYRYAYRLSGHGEDAEDLTQQTFLMAQRKLYQLREPEKAVHWLFAILRSCYFKSRRKRRPVPVANLEMDVEEVSDGALRKVEELEIDEERLQQALAEIPDDFKIVLLMFYFEELSYKEIAARLEIKIGTVMSRLSRAKIRLRQRLAVLERGSADGVVRQQNHHVTAPPTSASQD